MVLTERKLLNEWLQAASFPMLLHTPKFTHTVYKHPTGEPVTKSCLVFRHAPQHTHTNFLVHNSYAINTSTVTNKIH